jgi:tetratricopeptide (TPR) repeat protein
MDLRPEDHLEKIKSMMACVAFHPNALLQTKDKKQRALSEKGISLMADGRYREAVRPFRECLKLGASNAEKTALWLLIGTCLFTGRDRDLAVESWKEALMMAQEEDDKPAQAAALGNLGLAYFAPWERDLAIECFERSLRIRESIGDQLGRAQVLYNLGNIHLFEQSKAIKYFEEALPIFAKLGDDKKVVETLVQLARMHEILDGLDQMAECYEEASKVLLKLGDRSGVAKMSEELASSLQFKRQWDSAVNAWRKALADLQGIGDEWRTEKARMMLCIALARGDTERAQRFYEKEFANHSGNAT